MAALLLLGAAVLVLLVLLAAKYGADRVTGKNVLSGYPIVGVLPNFMMNFNRLPDWLLEHSIKFGGNWWAPLPKVDPFGGAAVCLADVDSVEHVLKKNFDNYVKGEQIATTIGAFLGNGIFAVDGPRWIKQRKIASHMFSQKLMRAGFDVAKEQGKKLLDRLGEHAASKQPANLQDLFFRFTMDTFCFIAFGVELHSLDHEHPFAVAFDNCQRIAYERFQNPFWRIGRMLGFKSERDLVKYMNEMDKFAYDIMEQRRGEAQAGSQLGPDLVSRFLEDAMKHGKEISNEELRDVVINFIIAGRDTTACALSWMFFEMLRNPEVLAKATAEVDEAYPTVDDIDFATITQLPYLQAVASETLRLHPSVPKQAKWAVNDDVLPDGTKVKAGTAVLYSAYAMGRNPNFWEEPLKFDPGRWLKSEECSQYKSLVFNAGPRLCLGKPLAYLEIKLMAALVLKRFSVSQAKPANEEYINTLVLPMKSGIYVNLKERA